VSVREAYETANLKYSPVNATRFFQRPHIAARVQEIVAERAKIDADARRKALEANHVDRPFIIKGLRTTALTALRGVIVRDRNGRKKRDPETGEVIYKPDFHAANRAFELLGKDLGMFIDRLELGRPGEFAALSDAELRAEIIEAAEAAGAEIKLLEGPKEAAE
jgi:phage terminase small subunit